MKKNLPTVAYFCMEYGLRNDLKWYAGGLGILAGDYLKGAKDAAYPIVGVGIKWKQGYTDQLIDADGKAYDTYHNYDYELTDTGVEVQVDIRNRPVFAKVWKVDGFGNADLYLLDTDLDKNEDAWITGQLYGWFEEERVAQEMILGVGGMRALDALGIEIDRYHFNEGHAVFAGLEHMRTRMAAGESFDSAWGKTRACTVFTTHTPVIQGNETHPLSRLRYMGVADGFLDVQMEAIGGEPFNMTVAALRLSKKANAVAELHAVTANEMWKDIEGRCKIVGITNGIHLPTWVDDSIIAAVDNAADLWEAHMRNKRDLLALVKQRNGVELDAHVLTIGFSRRAAPYKRSDFIFSDESIIRDWFDRNLVQIIFSGKAHPLDDEGKAIVERLVAMSRKYPKNVVFLENYDMTIGAALTRGADVWLNNPRRPKEASGTSGMKAAMNGGLNCSILDGWWPECCEHGVNGWQFGDGFESANEETQDTHDLIKLYQVLNDEVIPLYYSNNMKWIEMMKNSILSTKDKFGVKRMLDEYYTKLYE